MQVVKQVPHSQLSISVNICQYLSISVNICQYLSISVNICQYLSISVNICQYLSISVNICQYLSISVNICQYLSISVNICQYLSISVNICQSWNAETCWNVHFGRVRCGAQASLCRPLLCCGPTPGPRCHFNKTPNRLQHNFKTNQS